MVQPKASVLYMIRSNHVGEAVQLQERVDKIAQGAALMTDTRVEKKIYRWSGGYGQQTMCWRRVLYDSYRQLGVPAHTEEELAYTDQLAQNVSGK